MIIGRREVAFGVQVDDRVGDDFSGLPLVAAARHHDDGNARSPRHPEHHFVPLHDAVGGDGKLPQRIVFQDVRSRVVDDHVGREFGQRFRQIPAVKRDT